METMAGAALEGPWAGGSEVSPLITLKSPEMLGEPRPPQPLAFDCCPTRPPQEQSPSSATAPVSSSPELLKDLHRLREWYEEASRFERQIAQLSAKVQENDRRLVAAHRQASEASARKAQAAQSIPKVGRCKREVDSRLSAMTVDLQTQRENIVKSTKDNRGLRRSLQRLHQRLGHTVVHTDDVELVMRQEAELEEMARVEEDTLMQTINGMDEVQQRLTKQVALEREKRLQLQAAARAKLERVEKSQAHLKEQVREHDEAVSEIKQRLSEQEKRTQAAQQQLAHSREAARQASQCVEQQKDARRAMHAELLGVQRAHERLRSDMEMTLEKLEGMSEREAKAQQSWRLQHMERLDARLRVQRGLDQDVLVAEDPSVSTGIGGG